MPGGVRVVQDNRSAIIAGLESFAERLLDAAAVGTKADAQNAIRGGSKTGRTYRRGAIKRNVKTGGARDAQLSGMGLRGTANAGTGKTAYIVGYGYHRASAKGEAPADDTGKLAGSIMVQKRGRLRRRVVAHAGYARRLELEMDRPFLVPAFEKRADELRRNLRRGALRLGTTSVRYEGG